MKTIILTQGFITFVDDSDFEAVSAFKWHVERKRRHFYASRSFRKPDGTTATQSLHKFLLPGSRRVDHRDGNGLNNQRYNLRPATNRQNSQGFRLKASGTTSKFRGVCWCPKGRKYHAQLQDGKVKRHLGYFTDETEAARAYDSAAREHFGEFASPNFL